MTETENKFADYAEAYLKQWKTLDKRGREIFTNPKDKSLKERAKALDGVLWKYCVNDNFEGKGTPREQRDFETILKIVDEIPESELSRDEALATMERVYKKFCKHYPQRPFVATSKILWLKFRSPIVVYDKYVAIVVRLKWNDPTFTYEIFCDKWRKKFEANEKEIREACAKLPQGCLDGEEEITSQPWFEERVFDLYLVALGKEIEASR